MPNPALFFADLVRETSNATGTGAFVLSGPLPGHRRFAGAVPVGVDFCYAIAGITAPAEWEVGTGQIDAQGRLVRASVSASSAAGALVPFTAGLKTVALTVGANWYAAVGAPPALGDISGLQAALDAKQAAGAYAAATHGHSKADVGLGNADNSSDLAKPVSTATQTALNAKLTASAISTFGLTLVDDTNAATARTTLGLGPLAQSGTKVGVGTIQPWHDLQLFKATSATFTVATDDRNDGFFVLPAMTMRAGAGAGFVGTASNHNLELGVNGGARFVIETGGSIRSGSDNATATGTAAFRWSTIYLGSSPVVTSDERDKIWHGGLNALECAAAMEIAASIGLYQWRDAVEVKGAAGARLHVGVKAQAVWRIMAKHGLVAPIKRPDRHGGRPGKTPYAFLCWDEWRGEQDKRRKGNRYGVRADQLTLFVVAALAQKMSAVR